MRKFLVLLLLATVVQIASAQANYVFENDQLTGPETIAATGYYEFTLQNNSAEGYDLSVVRLREGKTIEDYQAALTALMGAFQGNGDIATAFENYYATGDIVGGVNPGASEAATAGLLLQPGTYILDGSCDSCPASQQLLSLSVQDGPRAEAPEPDLIVEMMDFHFSGIPAEVTAGSQVWEVANTGQQGHVLILFKLAEDVTMDDLTAWLATPESQNGEPPAELGESAGGSSYLSPSARYYQMIDLEPGNYVAICPVPDPATGQPHYDLGMIHGFTVQ